MSRNRSRSRLHAVAKVGRKRERADDEALPSSAAEKKRPTKDSDRSGKEEATLPKEAGSTSGWSLDVTLLCCASALVMACDMSSALTGIVDEKTLCARFFPMPYSSYVECVTVANRFLIPHQWAMNMIASVSSMGSKFCAYMISAKSISSLALYRKASGNDK